MAGGGCVETLNSSSICFFSIANFVSNSRQVTIFFTFLVSITGELMPQNFNNKTNETQ